MMIADCLGNLYMKHTRVIALIILAFALLGGLPISAHAKGKNNNAEAGIEWKILSQEADELYSTGEYDRAVKVAQKALEVAEQNVGKNHPDVATSLNNLSGLYRATDRNKEAEALERRATQILTAKR